MSDFKAKMHQIRFPLGLHPRPRLETYSALLDPLAVLKRFLLRGREKERKGREERRERKGR